MTKKLSYILGAICTLFLANSQARVFAQIAFPLGGVSFDSATELLPGQYLGGQVDEKEGATAQQFYYLSNVKSGQAIEAAVNFSGDTLLDVNLYDENKRSLVNVWGGAGKIDKITWLTSSEVNSTKYYLSIKNDDTSEATDLTLDLRVVDAFDANLQTDVASSFDKAFPIIAGSYTGYISSEEVGSDQKDLYKFSVKNGAPLTVKVTPPNDSAIGLKIYDANRSELAYEYSSNAGAIIASTVTPANFGDYFISVEDACPMSECSNNIINYTLEINQSGSAPTGNGGAVGTTRPEVGTTTPNLLVNKTSPIFTYLVYAAIILGVILLIILVVAVILITRKPKPKKDILVTTDNLEAEKPVAGSEHPCRYCQKLIPLDATVCPHCSKANP